MSMNVTPVKAVMSAVNAAAPKMKAAKTLNLGENIMPRNDERTNHAKIIIYKIIENFAERSKAKPDADRTIIDYVIILADKLKDINPAKYAA